MVKVEVKPTYFKMSKIMKWYAGVSVGVIGFVGAAMAYAQTLTPVAFPTTTANALLAFAGSAIADPGLLLVVVTAAAVPFVFYIIHQLIGLIPSSRGRKK